MKIKKAIIAREQEKDILSQILNSNKAEFLAVYGRRRIGKTYLIREFFEPKTNFIQISGIKDRTKEDQIDLAIEAYEKKFSISNRIERPKTWKQALEIIVKPLLDSKQKAVLFIDELPWIASVRSNFLTDLDYLWNTEWSRHNNFKLVVCGSSSSWMLNKLINNTGGLYNRITQRIFLKPFDLSETREYLEYRGVKLSENQIVELYLVFGGIPYYLDLVNKGLSPVQIIQNTIFESNTLMSKEADFLFEALFQEHKEHNKVIKLLALSRYGVNRKAIQEKTKIPTGTLEKILDELVSSGFISFYVPFGKTIRDSWVRLSDEYLLFYYNWIFKSRNTLDRLEPNYWIKRRNSPSYYSWAGYSFENLCLKHYSRIISALNIAGMQVDISSWSLRKNKSNSVSEGAQIDLVLVRKDKIINLFEIKYTESPLSLTKELVQEIIRKQELFREHTKTKFQVISSLISANGVKSKNLDPRIGDKIITIKDLF